MNYIAQADVENYLGVALTPSGVNTFNTLLPLLQDMIDNYCNRSWNFTNPVTENFDALQDVTAPYATDTFFVKYPPVSGINSITVGGVPWDLTYVYNYKTHIKLWVRPETILLPNPLGFQSVVINYNSSAAGNPPPAIKLAFIEWMARKINTASDANKEVTKVQAGTVQAQYAQDRVGGIPDFVRLVLDSYRLPALDHF